MVNIKRWFVHCFTPPWRWQLAFPADVLKAIEEAVKQSENRHRGEIRFVIENALTPAQIWQHFPARQRAIDVFSALRVWDTEDNCGILIYVLLADRQVHILADRGINAKIEQREWDRITQLMQKAYSEGDFHRGSLTGIEKVTDLLSRHFPANGDERNELPDKPLVIR